MSRKNIKSVKDCLYRINKETRQIQILNISNVYYESRENIITNRVSHLRTFAMALEIGKALSLSDFAKFCESNRDDFKKTEIITIDDFEAISKYTIKACLGLGGFKKVIDNTVYFFATYRVVDNGFIFGEWLPFEENKENLGIRLISKNEESIRLTLRDLRNELKVYEKDKNEEKVNQLKDSIKLLESDLEQFKTDN